ncbi:group 1 glycosyl transferase [Leptolyngbya sp. Heron Island J]|uniref:glycosyltransferase family 4 protein n=1 Tax=Leptolyngbya sp. Heron Island J TaxID=1385935 RepID=UPI0003B9CFD9|nr:glycosyltransferase family 4 protein [Leptolyngbya sp. Heron Island J]ESA38660.1 group 1 glycosyl transferase [Leptolyngbya sp. Heron Island J]
MESSSKKLLMIFPSTLRGGVEQYNLTVSGGAVKHGWDVHAAFPNVDGTASLVQDFLESGVTYHPLAIAEDRNWLPGIARHVPRFFRTLRLLITLKPDVVQITLPAPEYCFASILACGLLKIPTVVRFGLVLPLEIPVNQWRVKLYNWVRTRQQRWVVISQNNRRLLSNLFQIPESELTCIYNGAKSDASQTLSTTQQQTCRQQILDELKLPDTAKLLITVGRLNFQKGHCDLIPAIPHIIRDFPDVRFIWVGDGDLRETLENQLNEYQVTDNVFLLGYRSDVSRLLQASDLFVFPTHFEGGQSFAIAEAMASGLPIITSDASGIPEVILHQLHGLVFRTGDSCDLLESMRWALKHPDDMRTMAHQAYERAQDFTEEKMIQNYIEVWQHLYQGSRQVPQKIFPLLNTDRA